MLPIIEAVLKYIGPSKVRLDDFVDRLCYRYTPMLLGLFMVITGTVDTLGKPLSCMIPKEFPDTWSNYVHQYCYVTGTYLNTYDYNNEESKPIFVHYYQWVPYVLILLALGMRLPLCFWRFGQQMSDVDFGHVNELCLKARTLAGEERYDQLKQASDHIYHIVTSRSVHRGLGSRVIYMYMLFKMVNIIVVVAQIYVLYWFVGYDSWEWGFILFRQSWSNQNWSNFSYFPRVSYCDFRRDFLGQDEGVWTAVRCTLGVNMLNEKVFLCLYFWYNTLLALTLFNAMFCFARLLSPYRIRAVLSVLKRGIDVKQRTMKGNGMKRRANTTELDEVTVSHVENSGMGKRPPTSTSTSGCHSPSEIPSNIRNPNDEDLTRFVDEWLGQDGQLLLRWVGKNAGDLVASELAVSVYELVMTMKMN